MNLGTKYNNNHKPRNRIIIFPQMEGVVLKDLWCQCRGNTSAVPHQLLITQQMSRLHKEAQEHVLWYVGVVLVLYVVGLALIIHKSGRTERHTAASAFTFCCSSLASLCPSWRGRGTQGDSLTEGGSESELHQRSFSVSPRPFTQPPLMVVPEKDEGSCTATFV